jgi:RNA polymerase sigma-70 factor (ECF subfamily)
VQLAGCLSELGDVHRQIVTLRVLEELSGEEAARALGLTPNHVAVLLHRARKQLERCMQAA